MREAFKHTVDFTSLGNIIKLENHEPTVANKGFPGLEHFNDDSDIPRVAKHERISFREIIQGPKDSVSKRSVGVCPNRKEGALIN